VHQGDLEFILYFIVQFMHGICTDEYKIRPTFRQTGGSLRSVRLFSSAPPQDPNPDKPDKPELKIEE
jgi:hypothetical protein